MKLCIAIVFWIISGDELFSDSFPVQLVEGVVYKVKGKVGDVTLHYYYVVPFVRGGGFGHITE